MVIRKRYEEGEVRWNPLYGYEKNEQGEYQIVPDEAAVVQLVYNLYEHGSTIGEIRKELAARQIRSPKGAETWTQAAVQCMLVNERYDGRSHFLHGRVFCGDCGAMMTRRTVRCSSRPDNKETHKVWTCKERHKGRKGNGCLMRNISEIMKKKPTFIGQSAPRRL